MESTLSFPDTEFCDICHDQNVLPFDLYKTENAPELWPGCEGSLTLNKHLKVYFIITKLFKLPGTRFLKLLLKPRSRSAGNLDRDDKEQKLKYTRICDTCDGIVNEAIDLHRKMVEIQGQIDKLGEKLTEMKVIGEKLRAGENTAREKKEDELMNLSLELLGGMIKKRKKGSSPKKSIKAALRKRKSGKAVKHNVPLEPNYFPEGSAGNVSFVEETKCGQELISEWAPDEMSAGVATEEESEELIDEDNKGIKRIGTGDDPSDDEDYEPPESIDNEVDDDDDEDEDLVVEVTAKKRKQDGSSASSFKKSIKTILRTRKSTSKKAVKDADPLAPDVKKIDIATKAMNRARVEEGGVKEADRPVDDEDFVPTESTDDDEDDEDDEDYEPKKKLKKGKRIEDSDSEEERHFLDSGSEPEDDEVEDLIQMEKQLKVMDGSSLMLSVAEDSANTPETSAYDYQCPVCQKVFSGRTGLNAHTLRAHGYETLYSCPKCPDLKFRIRKDLLEHRENVHGSICNICGKKVHRMDALVYHYKSIHKIRLTFTCPICKQVFDRRVDLRSHRKSHKASSKEITLMPERPPETEDEKLWASNPCQECGRVYLSGTKLESHLGSCHEMAIPKNERKDKRRKCYWCYRYFILEQRHWAHRMLMHPDKVVEFPCESCTETVFQTTEALLGHYETAHSQETVHSCHFCKWPFLSRQSLKLHLKGHVNKKPDPDITDAAKLPVCRFNCYYCWELFPTQEKLDRHLRISTRHRKPRKNPKPIVVEFPCDDFECDRNKNPVKTVHDLMQHFQQDHPGKEVFTCDRCTWPFLSKDHFYLHKINHVPRRASQFKCPSCDHIASILPALRDHWNVNHGASLKIYECPQCNKRFTTRQGLSLHTAQAHNRNVDLSTTGVTCDKCGKLFKGEKALDLHIRTSHVEVTCPDCGLLFDSYRTQLSHRRKEHNYGGKMCPVCGRICYSRSQLTLHMSTHNQGLKFECHLCGKRVVSLEKLKEHLKKVHENKNPTEKQRFVCLQCNKGYSRKDSLDDHVRVWHTNETHRVWPCDRCGKRFKRAGYLEQHLKSASGCQGRMTLMEAEAVASIKTD